jgi:transmembrane sensor
MNQNNQERNLNSIDREAAKWAVRLESRALAREEQIALDRWLATDPRHPGALLRTRAAWSRLDRVAALRGKPTAADSEDVRIAAPARDENRLLQIPNRRWLVAASVVGLTIASAASWWVVRHANTYVSEVGEVRRVALSDGSNMVLNTATVAAVHFDKTLREIELSTGEGLFQVAKDPKRPFVVHAGSVAVRAVGTVFSVRSQDQRVDVTVTEGAVELIDTNGTTLQRVAANEHATVMDKRQVEVQTLAHDEAERHLAWRDGMVDFSGEALSAAVAEINRHNQRHIVIDDPILASRPVVGLFRANDLDGFALTVARALGAQSADEKDAIHLRSR